MYAQEIVTVGSAVSNTASQVITSDYLSLNDGTVALYCTLQNGGLATELLASAAIQVTMRGAASDITITADGVDNQTHISKGLAQWVGTDTTKGQAGLILPVDENLIATQTLIPQFVPVRLKFVLTRTAAAGTATYTITVKKIKLASIEAKTKIYSLTAPVVSG